MKKNETLEYDTIVALLKKCNFKAKKVPKLTKKRISKEKKGIPPGVKKMKSEKYVKRCED